MKIYIFLFFSVLVVLTFFSYGFVDPNLNLSSAPIYLRIHEPLSVLVFEKRTMAAALYVGIVTALFILYIHILRKANTEKFSLRLAIVVVAGAFIMLLFAYPAFSYDLFNYILTARISFLYRENPYVVMPIEIPNEPMLEYTRAANKVALYGPVWILLTFFPYAIGHMHIWLSIISFKALTSGFYIGALILVYRITKSVGNVLFFALNPLVLLEVLVSGHNDIIMMTVALAGLYCLTRTKRHLRIIGICFLLASVLVKGATLALIPLVFITNRERTWYYMAAFWLMLGIFFFTPLREELYPWYAVWFLLFAAVLPMQKYRTVLVLSAVFSFGLLLRHFPYILTREYGSVGPMWRTFVTFTPVLIALLWLMVGKRKSKLF